MWTTETEKQARNWGFGHSRFKEWGRWVWLKWQVSRLHCVFWWHQLIIRVLELLLYLSMQSVQNVHLHCLICEITEKWEQATENWGSGHLRFKEWRWWVLPEVTGFALEYCIMVTGTDYQGLESSNTSTDRTECSSLLFDLRTQKMESKAKTGDSGT